MPSRSTVVISLDPETHAILEAVKGKPNGNVSKHVRRAILHYDKPVGNAEQLGLLAEARYKQIKNLKKEVRTLILLLDTLNIGQNNTVLGRKVTQIRGVVFDE